jgi:ferredoxin
MKEVELDDNSPIKDTCENLGILLGCRQGICGTCLIEVEEGIESLEEKNQQEEDMALSPNQRLACQCKIKEGTIKIKV